VARMCSRPSGSDKVCYTKCVRKGPTFNIRRSLITVRQKPIRSILPDHRQMSIIASVGERSRLFGCAAHVGPGVREYPTSHSRSWYDVWESESAAMNLTKVHAVLRLIAGVYVWANKLPARSGEALCWLSALSDTTQRLFPVTATLTWWTI